MTMKKITNIRTLNSYSESGFTMFEILITIVVVGVGLLATGLLFLNGLRFNDTAYLHSQAATLATDIAEKFRANPAASSPAYTSPIGSETTMGSLDCTPSCSITDLAAFDVRGWKVLLNDRLPSGQGGLTHYAATTTIASYITITIQYSDRGDSRIFTMDATL
jgi:type IV pilus assembly protein PilV